MEREHPGEDRRRDDVEVLDARSLRGGADDAPGVPVRDPLDLGEVAAVGDAGEQVDEGQFTLAVDYDVDLGPLAQGAFRLVGHMVPAEDHDPVRVHLLQRLRQGAELADVPAQYGEAQDVRNVAVEQTRRHFPRAGRARIVQDLDVTSLREFRIALDGRGEVSGRQGHRLPRHVPHALLDDFHL
ncbi:hypothetical protein ACE1SV_70650 [Streptomyces sp. E-15]